MPIIDHFVAGYMDGYDRDCPWPNENRHPAYRHSFEVARCELEGKDTSWARAEAERIEKKEQP